MQVRCRSVGLIDSHIRSSYNERLTKLEASLLGSDSPTPKVCFDLTTQHQTAMQYNTGLVCFAIARLPVCFKIRP